MATPGNLGDALLAPPSVSVGPMTLGLDLDEVFVLAGAGLGARGGR